MLTSQQTWRLTLFTIAAIVIGIICLANAKDKEKSGNEQRLSKKDLPSAVISAFQTQYPNAQIKGVSKEIEDSTTHYEINGVNGKSSFTISYLSDGKSTEIEEVISSKKLPDSAQERIARDYPKGEIEVAEKVIKGDVITYEVKIENGKEIIEAVFDSTGTLITKEKATGKKEDD